MSQVRFFTDEDVYAAVARQLRAGGCEAISTPEAGRRGESDLSQLRWATAENRVLVTYNVGDFARLHHELLAHGEQHAGLIVSKQRPIGDTVRRLLRMAKSLTAEQMHNRLEYLGNW